MELPCSEPGCQQACAYERMKRICLQLSCSSSLSSLSHEIQQLAIKVNCCNMTTTRWLLLAQLFQSESPEAEDNRGKIVKSELIGIYPGNMESSQRVVTLKKIFGYVSKHNIRLCFSDTLCLTTTSLVIAGLGLILYL